MPYLFCSFVTIHYWHVAIHQNVVEAGGLVRVLLNISFDDIKGLLSIESLDTNRIGFQVEDKFENDVHGINIEGVIINNENSFL